MIPGSRTKNTWSRWLHLALALQLGWIVASAGLARAEAAYPAGYLEAFESAQREFDAAHFEAARAEFARADRLFTNARTQLGLGRCEFQLRNYVRAIPHLKAALSSKVLPLDERTQPIAEGHLKLAEHAVGRFTIESNSQDVNVSVDGDPVALSDDRKLMLNPGSRLLEVGADDYESQQLQLIVKGGEDRRLSFALKPATAWYADPWFWIGAGVVIAGATTAIVVLATSDGGGSNAPMTGPPVGP